MVSLGCPKALVDSERILTKLRSDGYALSPDYAGADVVLVNTCGFLDSAKEESLEAIGEAMAENGRVIVTGCLGREAEAIRARFPDVLAITGAQQYEQVVQAVHEAAPAIPSPFTDLVPPAGLKLTPRHYSYLKISEGCNHACSFCIIPDIRGRLVSRRPDAILREAERLVAAGTRELLVISQDTSAYGVDIRREPRDVARARGAAAHDRPGARAGVIGRVGAPPLRLPLPARGRGHPADGRRAGAALSRHPVPARQPVRPARHAPPRQRGEGAGAAGGMALGLPGNRDPLHLRGGFSGRDGGGLRLSDGLAGRGPARTASAPSGSSR